MCSASTYSAGKEALMDYFYPIWKPSNGYQQVSQDSFTSPQLSSDVQKCLGETLTTGQFLEDYAWCSNSTGSSPILAPVNYLPPGYVPVSYAYTRTQMRDFCSNKGTCTEVYNASTGLWTVALTDYSNTDDCAETYWSNDSSRADAYGSVFMKAVEAENGSSDDEPYDAA